MAFLVWIPSRQLFLRAHSGSGDSLSAEDCANGFASDVYWNTFSAEVIDIDGELELSPVDGGIIMCEKWYTADDFIDEMLPRAYEFATGRDFVADDVVMLKKDL